MAIALVHGLRAHRSVAGLALAAGLCLVAAALALPLSGPQVTGFACLLLLLFGLPHGALDLELIQKERRSASGLALLLVVYLGLAAAMYALWVVAPTLALAAFIVIAIVHFSEDWAGSGSTFLAMGQAAAVLAAPTFLHRAELDAIFMGLTARPDARLVTEALTLIAPVAAAIGFSALFALWSARRRSEAVAGSIVLLGMVVLPPIVGFALYFCLFHSPRHLSDSLKAVRLPGRRAWLWVILPLTATALAIAAAIYGFQARAVVADRLIAASFMTLSILTAPHMMAPFIMRRLDRRALSQRPTFHRIAAAFTPH